LGPLAAEALETTQSAVSLKIKRLEDGLRRRLLERTARLVRLSSEGGSFLGPARDLVSAHQSAVGAFAVRQRRLVVGISHHVVGAELPILLQRMSRSEPDLVIEMRVAASREVMEEFDHGSLDAAIVLRHDSYNRDGELVLQEQFGWMAAPDFTPRAGEPLRLATQTEPCSVRGMALAALNEAGIAWTEVFVGGGTATIGAAVSAGLGGAGWHDRYRTAAGLAAIAGARCGDARDSHRSAGAWIAASPGGGNQIDRGVVGRGVVE
jgi:DNA-binding transcriptional LysR family regulator